MKLARRFEALGINSAARRRLFTEYGASVLPLTKKGKAHFPPLWQRDATLKDLLEALSEGHCAYCQSPAGADQDWPVEHFKPKTLFPTSAYDWKNFFISCGRCNRHKSNKWPKSGGYICPDKGDPSAAFQFHEDGRIEASKKFGNAQETIDDFQLDRKGLRSKRALMISHFVAQARRAVRRWNGKNVPLQVRKELEQSLIVAELFPYSAAINQCVRSVWNGAFPKAKM